VNEDLEINGHTIKELREIVPDKKQNATYVSKNICMMGSVRSESFTSWDNYEIFEGKTSFIIYEKSRFLDYIKSISVITGFE